MVITNEFWENSSLSGGVLQLEGEKMAGDNKHLPGNNLQSKKPRARECVHV